MAENPSNFALLVVHISNDERLNSDETDDFILVSLDQYEHAAKVLKDAQKHRKSVKITTLREVKDRLDKAKIEYEIVESGTRIYLGIVTEETKTEE